MNLLNWETEIESWLRYIVKQIHCGLKKPWTHTIKCTNEEKMKKMKKKKIICKKNLTLKRLRGDGGFSNKLSRGKESGFRGVTRSASWKKVKKCVFLNKLKRVARIPAINFIGQMMTPTCRKQIEHSLLLSYTNLKVR